jgi:hypothetical protein
MFDMRGDVILGGYHCVDNQSSNVIVGVANVLALCATPNDRLLCQN